MGIGRCYCQLFLYMLIQHLTKDVFCDRCYGTVMMAFIVADVVP